MKNILKLAVVGVAMMVNGYTATAQKIAHVNLDSLISIMPESKVAQQAVQDYAKQLETQVTAMQQELQAKYQKYQEEAPNLAEVVKATREKELNDLNQRITDFQQQAQTDYQKKSAELSKPVYEKAKKAIDAVAKENGFRYVFDTSTGMVIYNEPADDIIALVIKKLGITPGATPLQPTTNPVAPTNKGTTNPPKK